MLVTKRNQVGCVRLLVTTVFRTTLVLMVSWQNEREPNTPINIVTEIL